VSTDLEPAELWSDPMALPAYRRILRQKFKALFNPAQVQISLSKSPVARCEGGDSVDIVFSLDG
jgi:hypothetical protein